MLGRLLLRVFLLQLRDDTGEPVSGGSKEKAGTKTKRFEKQNADRMAQNPKHNVIQPRILYIKRALQQSLASNARLSAAR
jgi:hypothetical protein